MRESRSAPSGDMFFDPSEDGFNLLTAGANEKIRAASVTFHPQRKITRLRMQQRFRARGWPSETIAAFFAEQRRGEIVGAFGCVAGFCLQLTSQLEIGAKSDGGDDAIHVNGVRPGVIRERNFEP